MVGALFVASARGQHSVAYPADCRLVAACRLAS